LENTSIFDLLIIIAKPKSTYTGVLLRKIQNDNKNAK